jgi:hypothetical protein
VLVVVLIGGDCGRGTDEGLGRESTREAMELEWNPNETPILCSHLVFEGFDPSFGSAIGTRRGRKRHRSTPP